MSKTSLISPWQEHAFWLEILEDHSIFLRDHLSSTEQQYVTVANQFIQSFGKLRAKLMAVDKNVSFNSTELIQFSKEALQIAADYYQLEGLMQNLRVQNKVNFNLTPTYLSGTLMENREYLRILSYYVNGQDYPLLPLVDLLDLWLTDQLGHTILFRNLLDPVEVLLLSQTDAYINRYRAYIVQNKQMISLLSFTPTGFPRQQRLSRQIAETTIEMYNVISGLISQYICNEILTRTTLRFLEHHLPETCYFLKKLSYYLPELENQIAQCPLTKPSFS